MNKHCFCISFVLALCLGSLIFSSCKDKDTTDLPSNSSSSAGAYSLEQNVAASQVALVDAIYLVELAIDDSAKMTTNFASTKITKEKANASQSGDYPMILTINFGSDTSLCFDNRYRVGQIKAKISNHWKQSGSTMEIQAINYYFDNRPPISSGSSSAVYKTCCAANFTEKVTFLGNTTLYNGSTSYPTQKIEIPSANISLPQGSLTLTTNSSVDSCAYIFYSEGFSTDDYLDDKIMNVPYYEGSASSATKSRTYVFSIVKVDNQKEGLDYFLFSRFCGWPSAGDLKLMYRLTS